MHAERLLNIAKACRESPSPEKFDMSQIHMCGTPACALGHYVARKDLQQTFELRHPYGIQVVGGTDFVGIDSQEILDHFGITASQAAELFDEPQDYEYDDDGEDGMPVGAGCGNARTAIQAAEYIERFVERNCR